ncbi:hypothetical protein ES705_27454 [subsurface metagenome]
MSKTLELYDREEFYRCLQCAVCTGSCPAARVIENYNPREIILKYILNREQEVMLKTDIIWCCTTCRICEERCPHGIHINSLLTHIKNLAAKCGNLPDALRQSIMQIAQTGRPIQATPRSERIRLELGLKPLENLEVEEIRKIFLKAGLGEILELK